MTKEGACRCSRGWGATICCGSICCGLGRELTGVYVSRRGRLLGRYPAETLTCGKDEEGEGEGVEDVAHICGFRVGSVMHFWRERFGSFSRLVQLAAAEIHPAAGVEHQHARW